MNEDKKVVPIREPWSLTDFINIIFIIVGIIAVLSLKI